MKQVGPDRMLVVVDIAAGDDEPQEFILLSVPEGDPAVVTDGEALLRSLLGRPILIASDDEVYIRASLVLMYGENDALGPRFRVIETAKDPEVDVGLLRRVVEAIHAMRKAREKKEKDPVAP